MNHYIMIRRLRGPAFLMLVGVLALLNQMDILSWGKSWPLLLILAGVLALAERAALATGGSPQWPHSGQPLRQAQTWAATLEGAPQAGELRIISGFPQDSGKDPKGGQS